jgi:hypothetical protein
LILAEPRVLLIEKDLKMINITQGAGMGLGIGHERADEEELDEFIVSLRTQLEIFLNRSASSAAPARPAAACQLRCLQDWSR